MKLVLAGGHAQLEARHRPEDALQRVPHGHEDLVLAPQSHAVRHGVVFVEEAHLEFDRRGRRGKVSSALTLEPSEEECIYSITMEGSIAFSFSIVTVSRQGTDLSDKSRLARSCRADELQSVGRLVLFLVLLQLLVYLLIDLKSNKR